ncbi:MAG: amidohydrolase family protein [Chloroflexi bacterium]|nr:amidohydrolase family protein [Chloroflexota bacterium]
MLPNHYLYRNETMDLPPIVDAHRLPAAPETADDFAVLLAARGVQRTVLVQPEPSAVATDAALDAADSDPLVAAAAVWADVTSRGLGKTLRQLERNRKLRGLCLPACKEPDNHWLTQPAVLKGLREVAQRGLSLDVIVEPRQVSSVRDLAEAVPDLRIAVAHIGSPFIARSEREPWGVHMLNLAPCPNVWVKVSGLVTLDTEPWSAAHLRLFVEPMVRLFGYRRMMFGSDWPNHVSVASYEQVLDAAIEAAGPMTDAQLAEVLGGTAAAFYRLG